MDASAFEKTVYSRPHLKRTPGDGDFQFVISGVRYKRGFISSDKEHQGHKNGFLISGVRYIRGSL